MKKNKRQKRMTGGDWDSKAVFAMADFCENAPNDRNGRDARLYIKRAELCRLAGRIAALRDEAEATATCWGSSSTQHISEVLDGLVQSIAEDVAFVEDVLGRARYCDKP